MRGFLLAVWVLVPVVAGAFHYGPGQERLQLDDVQAYQAAGKRHAQQGDHEGAVKYFDEALARLPAGHESEAHRIRVERAKAMLLSQRLPEAYDDLTLLLEELQADSSTDPKLLADTRESLANAKYYLTWLMRLEGEQRTEWEPEIEAARQTYRLLAEQAESSDDTAALKRHQEDLEATIRLARMDLSELQALPLPSQCKGCCSGDCNCKGNGKGKGKGKGQGKTQQKKQGDEFARGASSGPPPDDGGN